MKWYEWIEGSELEQPYGNLPMVRRRCPYENDLMWVKMKVPIKMIRIDEIWTRISEMKWIEVKWVIWRIWLCEPYGNLPMVRRRWTLWEWLEWIQWESPYELRMSVPINLTWLISVRKSLCSVEWMSLSKWLRTTLWESPYGRLRVSLSKWLEWSQWESPYQNDQIWWDLS